MELHTNITGFNALTHVSYMDDDKGEMFYVPVSAASCEDLERHVKDSEQQINRMRAELEVKRAEMRALAHPMRELGLNYADAIEWLAKNSEDAEAPLPKPF